MNWKKNSISYLKIALKTFTIIWGIIKGIFLMYAVLFSVAGTIVIITAALYISKPILNVKRLGTENPAETRYMTSYRERMKDSTEVDTLMHIFVPLDSISDILVKAVIAAEDDGFYVHPGFDLVAILNAYEYNRSKNRLKHGASTLTQQMAKNFFVGGEKKFTRKYQELAYTILMETLLGKERILELYLNYAQWGKHIFGCEAASQYYFSKPCKNLTADQAARLAAVLAKPNKLNPHYTKSILLNKRLRVIGDNLYRRHMINDSMYTFLTGTDSLIHVINNKKNSSTKPDTSLTIPIKDTLANKKQLHF